MKHYWHTFCVYATISTVLCVAFFGFSAMAMDADYIHGHASCLATAILGNSCPGDSSPLSFINFHVSAFNISATGITQTLVILALVFMGAGLFRLVGNIKTAGKTYTFYTGNLQTNIRTTVRYIRQLTSWLALHENSPHFYLAAV